MQTSEHLAIIDPNISNAANQISALDPVAQIARGHYDNPLIWCDFDISFPGSKLLVAPKQRLGLPDLTTLQRNIRGILSSNGLTIDRNKDNPMEPHNHNGRLGIPTIFARSQQERLVIQTLPSENLLELALIAEGVQGLTIGHQNGEDIKGVNIIQILLKVSIGIFPNRLLWATKPELEGINNQARAYLENRKRFTNPLLPLEMRQLGCTSVSVG